MVGAVAAQPPPHRRATATGGGAVGAVVDDSVYFETNYEPRWAETFSWPEEEAKRATNKL